MHECVQVVVAAVSVFLPSFISLHGEAEKLARATFKTLQHPRLHNLCHGVLPRRDRNIPKNHRTAVSTQMVFQNGDTETPTTAAHPGVQLQNVAFTIFRFHRPHTSTPVGRRGNRGTILHPCNGPPRYGCCCNNSPPTRQTCLSSGIHQTQPARVAYMRV